MLLLLFINLAFGLEVNDEIESARSTISASAREERAHLGELFDLNQQIKELARRRSQINEKWLHQEAKVRDLAQSVSELEQKSRERRSILRRHWLSLYEGVRQPPWRWLFSSSSPVEMERRQRMMKSWIQVEQKRLQDYLTALRELGEKRGELKAQVRDLVQLKKELQKREKELHRQLNEKSRLVSELRNQTRRHLNQLAKLRKRREEIELPDLAFFERLGSLPSPVHVLPYREYGTFVDPDFRFRLMHKGLFYRADSPISVRAIFSGVVSVATRIPGFGPTIILDHDDNYYSVYAFVSGIKVREGQRVSEGEIIAKTGTNSPLFGPGLYFEIRHFTEAIDPAPWIKEPVIKAAQSAVGEGDETTVATPGI